MILGDPILISGLDCTNCTLRDFMLEVFDPFESVPCFPLALPRVFSMFVDCIFKRASHVKLLNLLSFTQGGLFDSVRSLKGRTCWGHLFLLKKPGLFLRCSNKKGPVFKGRKKPTNNWLYFLRRCFRLPDKPQLAVWHGALN